MKKFFKSVLEGIAINMIWEVIKMGLVLLSILLVILNKIVYNNNLNLYIIIFSCVIIQLIIAVLKKLYGNQYPNFFWDIIHKTNRYSLTFKSREKIDYTKIINAYPLRDNIKEFKDGEYIWSGSSSIPEVIEKDDYTLNIEDTGTPTKYKIINKHHVKKYAKLKYTIHIDLRDENHCMIPKNYIFIKRPTKKIILELNIPNDIPIKNVRYIARTKFGEENIFEDKKGVPKILGGHKINTMSYTYKIKNPKLFCEYEISWEWNN